MIFPAVVTRFLVAEVSARPRFFIVSILGGLVAAFLEIAGLGLVFPLLLVILDPAILKQYAFLYDHFPWFKSADTVDVSIFLMFLIVFLLVFKASFVVLFLRWQLNCYSDFKKHLSARMMGLYLSCDYEYHLKVGPSHLVTTLAYAPLVYDQFLAPLVNVMIYTIFIVCISALFFYLMPLHMLIGVVVMVAGAAASFWFSKAKLARLAAEVAELATTRNMFVNQCIGGITETKVKLKEAFFLNEFECVEEEVFARHSAINLMSFIPSLLLETLIITTLMAVVGNILFSSGNLGANVALVGLLAVAMFRLMPVVMRLTSNLQLCSVGLTPVSLIAAEMDKLTGVQISISYESIDRLQWESIEFQGVSFDYPDGTAALEDLNFSIKRGQRIGIVGRSGSGKSSLLLLFLGLVEPSRGRILVDGRQLSGSLKRRWQTEIGFVPQQPFIVKGSIAENIAFGEVTSDSELLSEVVNKACLSDLVENRAEGVYASVGEWGTTLSGGQKQRIGIARALYGNPSILVFDEATSALDSISERAICSRLDAELAYDCRITVAHRIGTIKNHDQILFLDSGRISGFDSFEELLNTNESFKQLVDLSAAGLRF